MACEHGYLKPERRCDTTSVWRYAEQQQRGYVGGIAYALRLLTSPRLNPPGTPINLLAGLGVLKAMLDGEADRYASMAEREMEFYRERQRAQEAAARPPVAGATEGEG